MSQYLVRNVTQQRNRCWYRSRTRLPRWRSSGYPFTTWTRKRRVCTRWRELRCSSTENWRLLKGRDPSALGDVQPSFTPGIHLTDISKALPDFAPRSDLWSNPSVREEDQRFLYARRPTNGGVETRTSSPVCIKRGKDFQSINPAASSPAGEGAGYAGGILSAGIDGITGRSTCTVYGRAEPSWEDRNRLRAQLTV